MEKWLKNSKKGMAMLAAVAFMLVAGWQFGVSGTEAPFSETEVALEKAIAGSGNECPIKVNDPDWYYDPTCECILWWNDCYCGPGWC